jgi:GxxExxY protein
MILIEEALTRSVLGGFYDSYNKLSYGFLENVCVGALVIELERRGHRVAREVPIAVYYDGIIIGSFRADLVVDNKLIVEVKAEPALTGIHERQLRNYLTGSVYEVGLLLGYGPKPEHRRVIHTRDRKSLSAPSVSLPCDPCESVRGSRPLQARTVEARTVEARTVEARTVEGSSPGISSAPSGGTSSGESYRREAMNQRGRPNT